MNQTMWISVGLEIVGLVAQLLTKLSATTGLSREELLDKFLKEREKFNSLSPDTLPKIE